MSQTNSRRERRRPPRKPEQLRAGRTYEDAASAPTSDGAPSIPADDQFLARELHLNQALIKAAIAHLDLNTLLPALLDPIKDMMDVDNVAILLVAPDGQHLDLHAAHGLEEEVVGKVSVPIGKGFAGRIAASRYLLFVPNLAEFDAVNPLLGERILSAVGVPLLVGERLLGVLHIGAGTQRLFTSQEIALLQHVAEHVALAIDRALLYRGERETWAEREHQTQRTREALDAMLELAGAMVSAPVVSTDSDEDNVENVGDSESSGEALVALRQREDEPIYQLAALCSRILGCERIAIIGTDAATGRLRPIAVSGSSPQKERFFRAGFDHLSIADRFGAEVEAALQAGESVLFDVQSVSPDHPATLLSQRYFLMSPMLASGVLTGYIGANFGDNAEDYTPENRALTHAAAQLIGGVMERQRLARERTEAQAEALSAERAKRQMDDFLSIAGHELRTPITSAKLNVNFVMQLLDRFLQAEDAEPTDAEDMTLHERSIQRLKRARDLLERTNRQFKRQERLINDLLDLSRVDVGKLDFRFETCDFVAIAQDSTDEQQATNPGRSILFSAPDHPLPVWADADRLIQVVDNLLSNAIKYSEPDTPIAVRVCADGDFARYEVKDEGPGLSLEDQGQIWQRYYRVNGIMHQTGSGPGLGLGLFISKTIVERHGGDVGVESEPGKGSTFWFKVPLSSTPSSSDPS
ncbi:MAG TPA: GAF domain-containing sensor histidine kinase [Ktedonobacterales bacterium]|nr:GAF domain-containing sensor histidine kinase [Ktedonobacterales bacterium]